MHYASIIMSTCTFEVGDILNALRKYGKNCVHCESTVIFERKIIHNRSIFFSHDFRFDKNIFF